MAHREVREAGRTMRRRIEEEAERRHRPLRYAEIKKVRPLTAHLTDGTLVLDEDDLVFGGWARQFRKQYGLKVGETLAVQRMGNGDWFVTDVLTDRKAQKFRKKKGTGEGEGPESPEEEEPQEGEEEEDEIDLSTIKGSVIHGTDPTKPRPEGHPSVEWIGDDEPVNAIDYDTWIKPPLE